MTERAWAVIPEADKDEPERSAPPARRHSVTIATGAVLIGLGGLLLVQHWLPRFGADALWPLVVLAVGVTVLISARR